ncbi:glycosyltransferase family 87 protein [Mesorhizobium sp. BAC0120]|uniref:glycosyltransferase family 87 protein n=1 Tax=Mesorhizobium sp. BAC0120 TaxID=3090670 RepID=UPI00298BFE75|nr:glycosyltransferase family 87 protein [Mesorhizobium sp. BAC0120]MDW6024565.1 glycosyltransferase family 87 protein [Mesorhizobium sp. BAC0120]
MAGAEHRLKFALLVLGAVHLVGFCIVKYGETVGIAGRLYPDGTPVGGDFINLWTTAKLILADRTADIYQVGRFMAYERTFVDGADIGLRLWAYPPLSLLFVWPFGLLGYYAALAVWSAIGLIVLTTGARRFGFDRLEIAILLTSPATLLNLYFGQTGSLATGLLLLALSPRPGRDPVSATAGALLTIKPQFGFLLPLLWAFQGRWRMIAWTAVIVIGLIALAAALFGPEPWRDYLNDTLPTLGTLERAGSGPFMTMIPSMFMSLRIVTGNSSLASSVHAGFAALVLIVLVIRFWQVKDGVRRSAMLLIATVLMTPYLHNYDLALLLCGALLMVRRFGSREGPASFFAGFLVIAAWALPQIVVLLNAIGAPISPLLILPLLLLA